MVTATMLQKSAGGNDPLFGTAHTRPQLERLLARVRVRVEAVKPCLALPDTRPRLSDQFTTRSTTQPRCHEPWLVAVVLRGGFSPVQASSAHGAARPGYSYGITAA